MHEIVASLLRATAAAVAFREALDNTAATPGLLPGTWDDAWRHRLFLLSKTLNPVCELSSEPSTQNPKYSF